MDEVDNVDDTTITVSCGNVFLDAGLPEPHVRLIKADLILCLRRVIYGVGGRKTAAKRRRACEQTGLHEGQLIQVLDNKDHCCSIDQLGELLFRLGYVVDVQIRPRDDGGVGPLVEDR